MRPDNLLNTHKPSLDSNIINSPIGDSPSETRRQKLSRFRRNHQIDRPARTTPSNMVKCPKLRTTGPNTCQGNTSKTATECRRRIATASANRPGFGARSGELPSGFPINAAKITRVTKAIKGRIPPRRGIVTLQAPSTPSIPDNVLTGTSIASNRRPRSDPSSHDAKSMAAEEPNHATQAKHATHDTANHQHCSTTKNVSFANDRKCQSTA